MGPVALEFGLTALASDPNVNNIGEMNDINASRVQSDVLFGVKKGHFEHSSSQYVGCFFGMRGNQKDSGIGEGFVFIVESFMELNELNHESIVGTGNWSFLFDEGFSFFVVVAILEDDVSNNKGNRAGNTLNAMD